MKLELKEALANLEKQKEDIIKDSQLDSALEYG